MTLLVGATCWVLGAATAWAFFAGAERSRRLQRRRDAVLARDPDIGLLDEPDE